MDSDQTELRFKLIDPESADSSRTVKYILKQDNGTWRGEAVCVLDRVPHDVLLTKLK